MASKYRKVLTMGVQIFKQPGILLKDILQNLDARLPKYVRLEGFLSFDDMLQRLLVVFAHCFKILIAMLEKSVAFPFNQRICWLVC